MELAKNILFFEHINSKKTYVHLHLTDRFILYTVQGKIYTYSVVSGVHTHAHTRTHVYGNNNSKKVKKRWKNESRERNEQRNESTNINYYSSFSFS